jgi:hypothetical protein
VIEEADIGFNNKYYTWVDDAGAFNHRFAVGGGAGPFDMTGVLGGPVPHLTVDLNGGDVRNITFAAGDFANPAAATRGEISDAINADIGAATAAYTPSATIATAWEGNVLLLKSSARHPGGAKVRTIEVGGPARVVLGFPAGAHTVSNADVQTLALHELGHFLGLGDLYAATAQFGAQEAMYGIVPQLTAKRALHFDDEDGVNFLHTPDIGDAPDPLAAFNEYPTLVHDPAAGRWLNGIHLDALALGAEHLFGIKPRQAARNYLYEWIGYDVDGECESWQIDLDIPFDDGVMFVPNPPVPGAPLTITTTISTAVDAVGGFHPYVVPFDALYLNIWIDWNNDADWDDPGEHVEGFGTALPGPAVVVTPTAVPAWADPPFWVRVRLDWGEDCGVVIPVGIDATLSGPRGAAQFGEVEDYIVPSGFFWMPRDWYHPPLRVPPGSTRDILTRVFNFGTENLLYTVSSDHPCIQANVPPSQLEPGGSATVPIMVDGTGACDDTFIAGHVVLQTDDPNFPLVELPLHAVVADDYYECPNDPETFHTLENDYLRMYANANCQQWIHDIGYRPDTTFEVFVNGGTIVATTDEADTLVGRFMGGNDWRAGAQDKLYREDCVPDWEPPFSILYTKETFIEATHLSPPAHLKWFWWEIAKQVKFFNSGAPEDYQRIVIKYIKVKRQDPPGWWPDQTPFTDYEDTYIGFAMDLDAPYDTAGPETGHESGLNHGGYDAVNDIAYVTGFGRENPYYNDYHAGIALAEVNGFPTTAPYATANVKGNQYLYPTYPWGWKDGELYQLASTPGLTIQDPDSIVDRAVVTTAHKIDAGTDPYARAEFTIVEVLAPYGEAQMQALVDTARAIVERERILGGLPAQCGDVNGDFVMNVGDIVYLVVYLYKSGPAPHCPTARGDFNNDGIINVGDVVYAVSYLYKGGPTPVCPGIWY